MGSSFAELPMVCGMIVKSELSWITVLDFVGFPRSWFLRFKMASPRSFREPYIANYAHAGFGLHDVVLAPNTAIHSTCRIPSVEETHMRSEVRTEKTIVSHE